MAVVHQRSSASKGARITVLNPALADQIAAGEVVERPASVVKELVENAVDAGATRVDVELVDGGLGVIRVIDNGVGIHPEDLAVAIMRHGTSKIRGPEDLVDIQTLGFRGEALASMAAVAHLSLRSRQRDAEIGAEIRTVPGEVPRPVPVGMPMGTQVEIRGLFANVPARRKFMRSEATEVGHCSETLLRIALVNPSVHLTLRHGRRELLNLSSGTLDMRVAQVLGRRASGPFFALSGEEDQIRLSAWLASPLRNHGGRSGLYIVTRRRVVKERNISQILSQALGDALRSKSPVGCLIVEPPPATVDVNVHPQKSEIRFSDPQRVYAAIRRILAAELVRAPWSESASQGAQDLASTELIDAPGARSAAGRPDGPVDRWAARRPEPEAPSLRGRGAVEDPKSARAGGSRSAKGSVPGPRRRAWSGPEQSAAGLGSADQSTPEQGSAGQGNAESPILEQGAGGHGSAGRSIPEQGAGGYGSAGRSIPERGAGGHGSAGRSIPEQGAGGFGSAGQSTPEQGSAGQGNAESSDFERPHGGAAEDASRPRGPADPGASGRAYRLSTRALDPSYGAHKREIRAAASELRGAREFFREEVAPPIELSRPVIGPLFADVSMPIEDDALFDPELEIDDDNRPGDATVDPSEEVADRVLPRLLTCLPGPVAIYLDPATSADEPSLLAVDLRALRSHLVFGRLMRDLRASRSLAVQRLLQPVVVACPAEDVRLCLEGKEELLGLGVDLDAFGDDAVVVRGVPAHLRSCLEDADVIDLIARVIPWLRLRSSDRQRAEPQALLSAMAASAARDPAARLAKRWIAELVGAGESLDSVPGVRRWSAAALLGGGR